MVLTACTRNDSLGGADRHDGSSTDTTGTGPETTSYLDVWDPGPDVPTAACSSYPLTSRVDSAGTTWWWWYFHWHGVTADLTTTCASYGADAKMVVEVDVPSNDAATSALPDCTTDEVLNGGSRACAIANAFRFVVDCNAGELLFELPSESTFHGYYHIETAQVPAAPRHLISQDVHCTRDLYLPAGPDPAPSPVDAGPVPIDTMGGGPSRDAAGGDGIAAIPPCTQYGVGTNSCGATCGLYPAPLVSGSDPLCPPCSPNGSDGACPQIGLFCDYLDTPIGGLGASCTCEASGWSCAV